MTSQAIRNGLNRLRTRIDRNSVTQGYAVDDPPLRAELFSIDQLEQHAKRWPAGTSLGPRPRSRPAAAAAGREREVLLARTNLSTAAVAANRRIAPAAEWLLDNFYLIEEQIRTARRHLPRVQPGTAPPAAAARRPGCPRVYDIALELITHVDGRVDAESLAASSRRIRR